MDRTLIVAIIGGLGGMLGWGLADFFAKKTIDEIGDTVTLVLAHLLGTSVFAAVLLARGAAGAPLALPSDAFGWAGLAVMGGLQAAVYLLVYRGFGKGQLAVLNPVFATFSGITALLSIMLLGEAVHGQMGVALAIVFAGVILINLDVGALRERRFAFLHVAGFPEIAAATVLAAGWTLLWDLLVKGRDTLTSAALMYFFMTVTLLAVAVLTRLRLPAPRAITWLYLALIGGCEAVAYAAVSYGYAATSHASVVALVSGAFSLPTIFLARVFLRERTTRLQALASVAIVAGIALLNVG